jgi:NAD(P)-dependent dehydrogenase (short-subunit alcohol dehydrogenase family)
VRCSENLKNRIAVVTGGAKGIGRAIAERLAREGAEVIIADILIDEARKTVSEIGLRAYAEDVNISDQNSVECLAEIIADRYGRCDILVNNAGILDATGINDMTMERYLEVIAVNQHGAIRVTKTLLPLIRKGDQAKRIINIASIMGVRGSRESIPYSTAKGAVVNFTRALACDLALEGITVNAIGPGFIDTDMANLADGSGHEHDTEWFKEIYIKHGRIPLGRAGKPEDISGPVLFFCSDDSKYVTGQILLVDGGVSATF